MSVTRTRLQVGDQIAPSLRVIRPGPWRVEFLQDHPEWTAVRCRHVSDERRELHLVHVKHS